MGKKKIAFYCGSLTKGGAERVFVNLAEYFYGEGYDVCMITQYKKEDEYTVNPAIERVLSDLTEEETKKSRLRNFFGRFFKLRRILKAVKPDLVLTCTAKSNFMTMAASTFLKTRVVVSVVADPKMEYETRAMRLIARTCFCFADGIVFQTKEARAFFPKYIQKKSVILSNALNPQFLRERYAGEREKEIVAVGRLDDNKNHALLINAFARIADKFPEYRLTIFGDGECRKELEALIAEKGLSARVILAGVTADVAGDIERAALFVLPSNTEGMPNTLLEAMALGLPVISTDCPCGGPRELIRQGENGILVPVGEADALAKAMEKVLSNPSEAEEMGRNAQKIQKRLKPEVTNRSWKDYFDGIIRNSIRGISTKRLTLAVILATIVSLLPLLFMGLYNVMCYDDFDFGAAVRRVWINTGSVWETVVTAAKQASERYMTWQGNWISVFLMAVYPANYNYHLAAIVPFISIGFFATAFFLAGKQLLTKWLGADSRRAVLVTMTLLFVFYQVLDAPFEGLYWYNGVITYMIPQALCFFGVAAVTQSLYTQKRGKELLWCIVAGIGFMLAAAGNYVTALQTEILMVFFCAYVWITNRRKLKTVLLPSILGNIGFLVNVLAPGNRARAVMGNYTSYSPFSAIWRSFYYAILYMIQWTPAIVILVWIALLPIFWQMAKRAKKTFRHPVLITLGAFSLLSAMFTPTLYAMGQAGLPRINNIIQAVYYLCLAGVTMYWFGFIAHGRDAEAAEGVLERAGNRFTAAVLLVALGVCCFTMDKNTYTGISAVRSIVKGEAQAFREENGERYALYLDEAVREVVIEPYSAKPALFHITDLSENPNNWMNIAVAGYFLKDSVSVAQDAESGEGVIP